MFSNTPRAKILIVDDTPLNIDVLLAAFGDRYSVITALDGEKAVDLARRERQPDLILLDIMMPGVDGYEVCRRLKADEATRNIPVIFLTALTDVDSELMGLELGAVDYVHKPFSIPLVLARVATQLELLAARRQLAAQVEQLTDAARLRDEIDQVMRHDLKTPLTPVLWLSRMLLADKTLTPLQRERVELIQRAGLNMLDMINRSMDLYKMEMGTYRLVPTLVDLQTIAQRVVSDFSALASACETHLELVSTRQQIVGDEMLCYSLLGNLVKNAIEASPPGEIVTVTIESLKGLGVMRIHNRGCVPAELRECFFDKFTTAGKEDGTGLGTYSARLMAETMGGAIAMETSEELGTVLTVWLPMQQQNSEGISNIRQEPLP